MSESQSEERSNDDNKFPVVGIGASAGGLEAFTQLLRHLSVDTGMAFVLIQHLAPNHESLLSEILTRATQMPVTEVRDNMALEPNCIYVIPPNTKMILSEGVLQLTPREKIQGKYMPVDVFFSSLAAERKSQAIAVVLSGTDGDGAAGIEEVKAAGGITFAQCEATAEFEGMPNTAAATGQVDFILPPQAIAEELFKISRHPYVSPQTLATKKSGEEETLAEIFRLLKNVIGVDFTHYKRNTVRRRIGRRMLLYKLEEQADYVRYLRDHPDEVQALYRDLLIIVTQFFRDESAFDALKELVFPRIASGESDSPIRIWIPGCATGEEVYSIAICLLEFLAEQTLKPAIQIFGTDLSETAIEKARTGIYQPNRLAGVSPQRLRRFFIQMEGGYQISKRIREMCIFARHDLCSDPPFSSLDLISCRNVLIYFASPLQKRVLPLFHYSLNPTGFLLLGSSESVGDASDLFAELNNKFRIYARTQAPSRLSFDRGFGKYPLAVADLNNNINRESQGSVRVQERAERIVLDRYAPVGVLCTERLEILQFRGDTSAYLRPAPGEPSFNLLKMVRPSLLPELRAIIHLAKRQDSLTSKAGLRIAESNEPLTVEIEAIPFRVPPARERYWLISFKPSSAPAVEIAGDRSNGETDAESEIRQLQQELTDSQAYLQATMEKQESTNQRLAAANEEILSSNEELQSTNEELQTAKEEIQAANEELRTTNDELQHRNIEARQSSDDLLNLLRSVELPVLMLQNDLSIRRFTPAAQKIFNLIASDVGRMFSDIRPNIDIPDLESLIREAIDTPTILEREVQDRVGRWYSLSIRPYKTTENQIDGAVLSLIDIDNLKRNSERLRASRDYAEAIVETVRQPLVVLDRELRVKTANHSFYQMFQVSSAQIERQPFFELGNGQWNIPRLRQLLEEILPQNNQFQDFEVEHEFEQIGAKTLLLNARELAFAEEGRSILLAIEDISQRQQLEAERTQLMVEQIARTEAEAANASKDQFISILSHELRTPLNSISGWSQILRQSNLDEETATRGLETIERNARLQSQLIDDLLDISRIIRGELRLEFRPFSLTSVIEAALETVRPTAEQKEIQLESNLAPCPARVSGDPTRIEQIICNLLSNAIKFTPQGGRVEIHLTCTADHAQIQTIDTGQGISPDFLPHIFERFRQSDSASTRKQDGLGLGLAIVRELVELHRGTVTAQSPGEGRGATFTVRLPLSTTPLKTSQSPEASPPTSDLTDIKILLVEDNDDARGVLTLLLEQNNASVTAVASAQAALEALNQSQPDIILSDISMPEVDGYTLIRQIRALPPEQGGQIPAIALTAHAEETDRQRAITAGFQRHIAKPVKSDELFEAIASLVARRDNS